MRFTWYHKPNDVCDIYVLCQGVRGWHNNRAYVCAVMVDPMLPEMREEEDEPHWFLGDRIKVDGYTVEPCRMDVDDEPSPDWLVETTREAVHPTLRKVIDAQIAYLTDDHCMGPQYALEPKVQP